MRIEHDVPVEMDDGLVLRADVFRPDDGGPHPVIMTHGPYAKGLAFQEGYAYMWRCLERDRPEALEGSSNRYQNWETVDPERWVPDGYVCIRVDSRGGGRSPGYLDMFSRREIEDFAACIEWAGEQPWSTGKVGLLGISYYAMNQWLVAGLKPRHLAAMCPWEGGADYYREFARHGGILNVFAAGWAPAQVFRVQHGVGEHGLRDPNTGEPVAGPETLLDDQLAANRADLARQMRSHRLNDDFYRERTPDLTKVDVPLLSAGNWAHHLHSRGNFEGFTQAASADKWLEVHGLEHWSLFYSDYGLDLQKRFFGHFLRGDDTGWQDQPPVTLNLRRVDGTFERRGERTWPIERTEWTRLYLDPQQRSLASTPPAECSAAFEALGDGLTFTTPPLERETEITGPLAAQLRISSSTTDADVFLALRVLDLEGRDVTFVSAMDPRGIVSFGCLRASQRKLDSPRTLPYRPWHTHDESQPLTPGEPVALDVEIWPTSVIVPAGHRIALTLQGRDFELPGPGPWPTFNDVAMRGHGIFVHRDPEDRPTDVFGGTTTLHTGPDEPAFLLLPVIPAG